MKWTTFLPLVVATLCGPAAFTVPASGHGDEVSAPGFASQTVSQIPPGYRDWRLISMAHEEGTLNDFRAIVGNDKAIKTYREGKLPFPDGTIIARIAWSYMASEENNQAFGRRQSFVPGVPTDSYLQVIVKDSKRYAATGGWGYGQFNKDGKPAGEAPLKTCFPCHEASKARDFVFSRYAP